jgi:hypothetical protein
LREDAKQLLRLSYERGTQAGGDVRSMDVAAAARERSLEPDSPHVGSLLEFMLVAGWVERVGFSSGLGGEASYTITARGTEVVREA